MYRIIPTFTINLSQIKVYTCKSSSPMDPLCYGFYCLLTEIKPTQQLRLVVIPIISQGFLYIAGGWPWDFWTINQYGHVIPSHPDIQGAERPPEPYPAALGVAFGAFATAASWDAPFLRQTNKKPGALSEVEKGTERCSEWLNVSESTEMGES